MTFLVETQIAAKPTGAAPQDLVFNLDDFHGETPKCVIVEMLSVTTTGFRAGDMRYGIGWATATDYVSGAIYANDGADPTVAGRITENDGVGVIRDGTGTLALATVAFAADTVTLTFNPNDGTAWLVRIIALGGDDLSVTAGTYLIPTSTTGVQEMAAYSFPAAPTAALLLGMRNTSVDGSGTNAVIALGATDGTNSVALAASDEHNAATTDSYNALSNDRLLGILTGTTNAYASEIAFSSWDSAGMDINVISTIANTLAVGYLILHIANGDASTFFQAAPTTTGTQTPVTGMSAEPRLALFWTAHETVETIANNHRITLGVATETSQSSVWLGSTDAAAAASVDQQHSQIHSMVMVDADAPASPDATATSSMDADTLTVDFTDAPPSAWLYGGLVLAGAQFVAPSGNYARRRYYQRYGG